MGLDLTISKMIATGVNEKGHNTYTYETVAYLRNSWQFMENLNSSVDFCLNNSNSVEFTGSQIWYELDDIDDKKEYDYVKEILEKAEVENTDDEMYYVGAWW